MSEELINELKKENLCTHFILPLLKLNKFNFVVSNYMNSYLITVPEKLFIAVQIIDPSLLDSKVYLLSTYYGNYKDENDYYYIVYEIPENWKADVQLFIQGKYSKFSAKAKSSIITWSRLEYCTRKVGSKKMYSDIRLMALTQENSLREMWEKAIAPAEKIQGELLSIPDETSFITFEQLTRI